MSDHEDRPCALCMSRRALLRGSAAGALVIAIGPAGCGGGAAPPSGPIPAGNLTDVAVGTIKVIPGENVILGRDQDGLYAMSQVCTHAGQLVGVVSTTGDPTAGIFCAAHGSAFDGNGAVTHGPAGAPLPHYAVDLAADGSITIQGAQIVAADVRTPAVG